MKKTVFIGFLLAASMSTAANSKDLCLRIVLGGIEEPSNIVYWKFDNVKSLKKIGTIVPLNGIALTGPDLAIDIISGSAAKLANGTVTFRAQGLVIGATEELSGGHRENEETTFSAIDCKIFPAF